MGTNAGVWFMKYQKSPIRMISGILSLWNSAHLQTWAGTVES